MTLALDPRVAALGVGWEPLAISEADGSTIWPRALYPCAEDALCAADRDCGDGWREGDAIPDGRAFICWAWESDDGPEDGWWSWSYAPEDLPGAYAVRPLATVECWLVEG